MKTKFKTLIYSGTYVDFSLLGNGIYTITIPRLFHDYTTIDSLIDDYEKIVNENFIKNLNKCHLIEVNLIQNEI